MTDQPSDSASSQAQSADSNVGQVVDSSALLTLINRGLSISEFAFHWLGIQCASLEHVTAAVLLMRDDSSNVFKPMAKWPFNGSVQQLAEVAEGVIEEQCGLLVPLSQASDEQASYAAAYPVHVGTELYGIVALHINSDQPAVLQAAMGQLQWSVGWLSLYKNQQALILSDQLSERSKRALELLTSVQTQQAYKAACLALVTALSADLGCSRVSIGFPKAAKVHVEALSHTVEFGHRLSIMSAISNAMAEALVIGKEVISPAVDNEIRAPDHYQLLQESGSEHLLSVPIFIGEQFYCVLTLERSQATPFEVDEIEFIRAVGVLSAASLEDKRQAQLSLPKLLLAKSKNVLQGTIGPNYIGRKLIAAMVVVLVLLFSFLQGEYRITAQTELEGSIQQVIAAPYNSYITSAPKKAGDTVSKGELIARLDDRELRLERKKWLTQRSQYRHEYNNAYAKQERAEVNISRAQMAQAEAELALVEERLRRSRLQAPFAGVVLSGDLSQRLGSFVEQGETLFEVAPLTNYRVILMVADNLIADVAIDQIGVLVLSALPSEKFEFVVTTITPVTEARDGNNFFRVEADITTLSSSLRPGMQGIGKITVGDRLLIANWTRGLIEWLQLQLWRWTP